MIKLVCRLCGLKNLTSKKGNNFTLIDLYCRGVGLFSCFVPEDLLSEIQALEEGNEYEFSFKVFVDSSKSLVCKLSSVN